MLTSDGWAVDRTNNVVVNIPGRVDVSGKVHVFVKEAGCNWYLDADISNTITTAWLNHIRDGLDGGVTDLKVKYMAWGSSATAPLASQTQLVTESGRKQITQYTDGADGVQQTLTFLAPGDAVQQIEELGWFAGPAATATADSGVMVARVLYSKNKTALETIQVTRDDTFA